MKVGAVYGPVQEDLLLVEALLDDIKQVDFEPLAKMLQHVLSGGGKRLRPALALLSGKFGQYSTELLVPLAASIELLHTATLVHDDVIDSSDTRRGRPTANHLYDNAASVMLGDFMFAHAAGLIARTGNIRVIRLFASTLMLMARGELDQDVSAYDWSKTIREYLDRISGKTASLFATAAEGGAIVAGAPEPTVEALRRYGYNLGMAFQIVDDILDFVGDESEMGKPVGSDLMQGTLTLPSLLLMERYPKDNPVRKYFANRKKESYLHQTIAMVRESDILDRSYAVARDFVDRALAALAPLSDGTAKQTLEDLAVYVVERRG
ncbi:MAG TPA: polyprenyl synthetase family protein [Dehalococcoidia bacterium]